MKVAIQRGVFPAALMAFIAALAFGTPELITTAILTVAGFMSAMLVVIAVWRFAPVSSWCPWKQQVGLWLTAAGGATAGCVLALSPMLFHR